MITGHCQKEFLIECYQVYGNIIKISEGEYSSIQLVEGQPELETISSINMMVAYRKKNKQRMILQYNTILGYHRHRSTTANL